MFEFQPSRHQAALLASHLHALLHEAHARVRQPFRGPLMDLLPWWSAARRVRSLQRELFEVYDAIYAEICSRKPGPEDVSVWACLLRLRNADGSALSKDQVRRTASLGTLGP